MGSTAQDKFLDNSNRVNDWEQLFIEYNTPNVASLHVVISNDELEKLRDHTGSKHHVRLLLKKLHTLSATLEAPHVEAPIYLCGNRR